MTLHFIVPGKPKGKGRPRIAKGGGRAFTPKATVEYENKVGTVASAAAEKAGWSHDQEPLNITIEALFQLPKKLTNPIPGVPDLDNIAKAILDGMQLWGVISDDRWVCCMRSCKRYADEGEDVGVLVVVSKNREESK